MIVDQLRGIHERVGAIERKILTWHRGNEQGRRLETIPGAEPITPVPLRPPSSTSPLPVGPRVGCLDRPGAAPELEWRQGTARAYQQERRSLFSASSRRRHARRVAISPQRQAIQNDVSDIASALNDFDAIADFIALDDPQAAPAGSGYLSSCRHAGGTPERWLQAQELRGWRCRQVVEPLFCCYDGRRVFILHVMRSERKLRPRLLLRRRSR